MDPFLDPFGQNRIHFGQFWLQIFSSIIITDFWYESEVSSSKIRFLDPFWTLFGPFLGTLEYTFGNFDSKSFIKIHFWYESQAFSSKTRYLAFLDPFGPFLDPFGPPNRRLKSSKSSVRSYFALFKSKHAQKSQKTPQKRPFWIIIPFLSQR